MKIKYQIISAEKLLLLKFSGEWSLNDYKNSLDKFIHIEDLDTVNKVLSDFRSITTKSAVNQIKELAEIRQKIIKKKYVHVRIVNSPLTTGLAHLYHEELNVRGYLDNYCSTIERAINLLNLNMEAEEIDDLLHNLDNTL